MRKYFAGAIDNRGMSFAAESNGSLELRNEFGPERPKGNLPVRKPLREVDGWPAGTIGGNILESVR
jgi:hypothetical protein